ncbi:uncharacterized protein LOC144104294 [Amblyomma americanum]
MVRLQSVSIRVEIFDNASFVDGFIIISRFHRCIGYSFFSWKNPHGEPRVSATILSPYLAFAVLLWGFFAFFLIHDTYRVVFLVRDEDGEPLGAFDKWVIIFGICRCFGVQVANVVMLVVYSHELCEVVKKMEAIESTFQRPTRLRPTAKFIVFLNVLFSMAAVYSICDEIALLDGYMEPVHMKVIYGLVRLVYAETVCLIGVSWIMYFSQAFASFLRCINEDIENLAVGPTLSPADLATLHTRFCELWCVFLQCDKIFGRGLLVTIPLSILNASPWGYSILTSHKSFLDIMTDIVGFITSCAELLALGAYSGTALSEEKKTWDALTKLLVSQEHTPEVREQIQEFRHTCQNQDFCFSACGFFKVGPPLIVSITSAIITYTVILYQSDSSSPDAASAPANETYR